MKKLIAMCLLVATLVSMTVFVQAAGPEVKFTSGSTFVAGGSATVDLMATAQTVMKDGSVTSDMYNAALEQNMSVIWRCSNGPDKSGKTAQWSAEDVGREYVCRVSFYSDDACTQFVDYIDSDVFVVSSGSTTDAKITPAGPFYPVVGKPFSQQLSCNVSGVTLECFRTSLPNGLSISSSGLISGTPTKSGFWYVTIVAYKNGEQIGDVGIEFHVSSAVPNITTKSLPEATVGKDYYVKLECEDPDASFSEYYNPGKPNELKNTGLILTQHGELEGKPEKTGTYTFTICAAGEGGEGYMTYTLTVREAGDTATTEATQATEATEPVETEPGDTGEGTIMAPGSVGFSFQGKGLVILVVFLALGLLVVAAVILLIVILLIARSRKKKRKTQGGSL